MCKMLPYLFASFSSFSSMQIEKDLEGTIDLMITSQVVMAVKWINMTKGSCVMNINSGMWAPLTIYDKY